jgi:hypothetical protein
MIWPFRRECTGLNSTPSLAKTKAFSLGGHLALVAGVVPRRSIDSGFRRLEKQGISAGRPTARCLAFSHLLSSRQRSSFGASSVVVVNNVAMTSFLIIVSGGLHEGHCIKEADR